MIDPVRHIFSCEGPHVVIGAMSKIMPELPLDVGKQWNSIKWNYFNRFGREGLYERVNNKTIAVALAEATDIEEPRVVESGRQGGLCFQLYAAPDEKAENLNDRDKRLGN